MAWSLLDVSDMGSVEWITINNAQGTKVYFPFTK